MLALFFTNAVGVALFGTLYAVAGARVMPHLAFLACLAILFAGVTTLWVRTEARHRGLEPLARLGRAAFGLVAVVVAAPVAVLTPMFWLESRLPAEAGIAEYQGPVMVLVLIAIALVALSNLVGAVVIAGQSLATRRARP